MDEDIRKAKEKGLSKMSVIAWNLLKAKIEAAVEELKGTKLKKNELLDSIYDQLQQTVTHDMITEDLNRVERAEGKLEEERGDNNAKYEAWASKYLAEAEAISLPMQGQGRTQGGGLGGLKPPLGLIRMGKFG